MESLYPTAAKELEEAISAAERLARDWGVEIEGPLAGATCSLVLAAGDFVLRLPLLEWERTTNLATLRAFSGHGGVTVLREDEASGAALLPRLRPGVPLNTLDEEEAIEAWIGLARRMRGVRGEAPHIEAYLQPLWTEPTELSFTTDVPALARRLLDTSPEPSLLHGDLHHYNVLRHGDDWVAIDPEGLTGDPAYECAAFLRNPVPALGNEPDLPELLRRRIHRLSAALEEPAARIWGWAMVRTAQCVWGGSTAFEGAWLKVARALDALREGFGQELRA